MRFIDEMKALYEPKAEVVESRTGSVSKSFGAGRLCSMRVVNKRLKLEES
jgi:hypothetical protein